MKIVKGKEKHLNESAKILTEAYFDSFKEAKEHFKSALSINPNDHLSLYHLGMCNFQIEDFINAAKYFKKSIKIDPDFGCFIIFGEAFSTSNSAESLITAPYSLLINTE